MTFSQILAVLVSGILFGFGLSVATMIQPQIVLGFLRFQDWGLMLVMGGAMGMALLAYQVMPRLFKAPLLGGQFGHHVSTLNRDTLVGAAIFGVGWGLCGICPGPAIAGLGTANWDLLWALAGILAGAGLQGWQASRA